MSTIVNQLIVPVLGLTFPIPIRAGLAMTPLTMLAVTRLHILAQRSIIDPCTRHMFIQVALGHHLLIRVQIWEPCCPRSDECQHRYPPCKKDKSDCLPVLTRWRRELTLLKTRLRMRLELEVVLGRRLQDQGAVQTTTPQ